ncbi:MAG: Rne/Rng family ribonuclease [Proteobacteria bacterium]|nr:Rne/Rng family ribonuclease [Pseudomonadota bacterium]
MSDELLINVNEFETRVALISGGSLAEIHLARAAGYSLTGNIYKGKVLRIIPGMQAAFIDIGLKRPGFLHANDIDRPRIITSGLPDEEPKGPEKPTDIRELLHDGQEILVQVLKDQISKKGARLTTQLAIASRYLVLMPLSLHIGISARIDEDDERERLRVLIDQVRTSSHTQMGFIARTAAEGAREQAIDADVRLLLRMWDRIVARRASSTAPAVVYEELPMQIRVLRDFSGPGLERLYVDHQPTYERLCSFVDEFLPEYRERLVHYTDERPLFERYGVDAEVARALTREAPLKSGGYLVVEQTEAMTTIDVNTGGFLGTHSLEETVYRTNLEAAAVIPRQLRLRNLGGIIVVDFIDMEDEEHQRQVLRILEKACEADAARIRIEGFSSLGLVQLSRKRTRESLARQICEPCENCSGLGFVKTAESTCIEVFRSILQDHRRQCRNDRRSPDSGYLIRATSNVVDRLLEEDAGYLTDLADQIGREIRIQVEPCYGPGEFDVVLVQGMSR